MIKFDAIKDTTGIVQKNNLEIILEGNTEVVKKKLTVVNKSLFFEMNRLKSMPASEENLARIKEIECSINIEFWSELPDGKLSIPSGFWFLCENIKFDNDVVPVEKVYFDFMRNYQKEAVEALLSHQRATAVLGTGLGKTVIAANICQIMINAKLRTMIVVPTQDLVKQTVKSLKKQNMNVCGVCTGMRYVAGVDVCVSTPQSAKKHIDVFDTIIIDEMHHSAASTWCELLAGAYKATRVYGLTATPYRTDGLDLAIFAFCGPIVFERSARWGIENNWLVKPDIYMFKIEDIGWAHGKTNPQIAYKRLITKDKNKKVFNFLYEKLTKAVALNRKILMIFRNNKEGFLFRKFCAERGFQIEIAYAKYRKPFYDFQQGKTTFLIGNVKLFGEGVDLPDIDTIITICNNSSEITTRQVLGRAMRLSEGKTSAIIYDVTLMGFELFEQSYEKRKNAYHTIIDRIIEKVI